MITLYHCMSARSFRALWMLEEIGLPRELKMLPFPPRVLKPEYLAVNPLGTIPLLIDGEGPHGPQELLQVPIRFLAIAQNHVYG